ncbi:DUF3313 family protein [Seongchinamella unica]|uniref:DUF3313 family protein n=1 Tax=Seongchinamella unica TaxID=2547392 RepID=A0A4V2ZX87_9GAMM|nr:DUF3313 family protein [Seongchinamella unica]TDG13664.1 DUF3313 family protein [Seongchinamella unica]
MKPSRYLLLSVLVTLPLLAACSATTIEDQPASEFSTAGLHAASGTGFDSAYVLPGANLPGYGQIRFEPFDVSGVDVSTTTMTGTTRRDWEMTAEKEKKLIAAWAGATAHAFPDYPREEGAGKSLRVEASLTRLSPGRAVNTAAGTLGSASTANRDVVNVSIEIRLFDADSGQLLALVRDRQAVGALQWTRAAGTDMTNLFNAWAALLHTRVSGR